ncbi:MAG: hypothetical protein WAO08_35570 [Hyphomicrobiaceae bacterium]
MKLKFELAAMVIFLGGGLALEWLLRVLVDEWWPLPWFILIMAAQVVVMVIPERQYARFRVWLDRHGMAPR